MAAPPPNDVPAMLAHADRSGRLSAVNAAWAAGFGRPAEALAGRELGALAHPDDARAVAAELAGLSAGAGAAGGTHRFGDGADGWRTLDWRAVPAAEGDGLRLAAHDVTRHRAELDAVAAEVDALTASLSHDLRAPLRAIDGFARILLADDRVEGLPEDTRRFLGLVRDAGAELATLLDELLCVTRVLREPFAPRPRVDVAALAREVAGELEAADRHARPVTWEIGELPTATADPAFARRLLTALLDNALKFTAPHEHARIALTWDAGERAYLLRDDGVGFDDALGAKAFGVFQRLHPRDAFPGSGVGLALAERIVRRHGGRIWAHAAPEAGASVWFTF
jgi:signal transduction histidine kinase